MPDSNIITQESWYKPPTEMLAFVCSHIRAANATRVSFTFYGATSEAESQFHGNARSSHYKQKHTEHLWEWNLFPPNLELLSTLRRSIEEWMESWHGRQLGEAAGLWQRSLIKNGLSRGISSKYEGGFKRGKGINLERKKKNFFQWKHIQTNKNKANFIISKGNHVKRQ